MLIDGDSVGLLGEVTPDNLVARVLSGHPVENPVIRGQGITLLGLEGRHCLSVVGKLKDPGLGGVLSDVLD